ncbi:MAG: methyl-accepting chemotaxis protein, partial [Kurthia sp.]|nr:methyl-accepting chemotaxis protein [Candidatus Kurthia equi]
SILTIIVTLTISTINYFMNMNDTINRLSILSELTVNAWSKDVSIQEVEDIINHDEKQQKKAVAYFDRLAEYQPQVAQGYIFGVELVNGNGTSVISGPSFLMKDFDKSNLHVGDIYTQPQVIADAIKDMKKTKKQTISRIYTDDYGKWLTVLKPLFNNKGEMIAYYGIDFDAQPYLDAEYKKIKTMILILIGLLVVVCFIQYLFMTKLFKPISEMKVSMRKITVGDYSARLKEGTDELGKLAKQFNKMSSAVASMMESIKETSTESSKQATILSNDVNAVTEMLEELNLRFTHLATTILSQKDSAAIGDCSVQALSRTVDVITHKAHTISDFAITTENKAKVGMNAFHLLRSQMSELQVPSNDTQINEVTKLMDCVDAIFKDILGQSTLISNSIQEITSSLEKFSTEKQGVITVFEQFRMKSAENQAEIEQITHQLQNQFNSFDKIIHSTKAMNDAIAELEVLVYTFKD